MTSVSETPVEAAWDPSTKMYEEFALDRTPEYAAWAKAMIEMGREIHTMTVKEMIEYLDKVRK